MTEQVTGFGAEPGVCQLYDLGLWLYHIVPQFPHLYNDFLGLLRWLKGLIHVEFRENQHIGSSQEILAVTAAVDIMHESREYFLFSGPASHVSSILHHTLCGEIIIVSILQPRALRSRQVQTTVRAARTTCTGCALHKGPHPRGAVVSVNLHADYYDRWKSSVSR
jgi:hypothetical protein